KCTIAITSRDYRQCSIEVLPLYHSLYVNTVLLSHNPVIVPIAGLVIVQQRVYRFRRVSRKNNNRPSNILAIVVYDSAGKKFVRIPIQADVVSGKLKLLVDRKSTRLKSSHVKISYA